MLYLRLNSNSSYVKSHFSDLTRLSNLTQLTNRETGQIHVVVLVNA